MRGGSLGAEHGVGGITNGEHHVSHPGGMTFEIGYLSYMSYLHLSLYPHCDCLLLSVTSHTAHSLIVITSLSVD